MLQQNSAEAIYTTINLELSQVPKMKLRTFRGGFELGTNLFLEASVCIVYSRPQNYTDGKLHFNELAYHLTFILLDFLISYIFQSNLFDLPFIGLPSKC